jgi:hypothetical protein
MKKTLEKRNQKDVTIIYLQNSNDKNILIDFSIEEALNQIENASESFRIV